MEWKRLFNMGKKKNDFSGPFLITGCYRSGTSYITQLLNNHPKLSATMHTVSFMRFCYLRYGQIDNLENLANLLNELCGRLKARWNIVLNKEVITKKCCEEKITYARLYDIIMRELYCKGSIVQWAEKIQLVWTKIPDFLNMFPNGKAIHIIRDPRSVLASFKKYTYVPEPAYIGAVFNCLGSMQAALKYKKMFPNNHILIRYEDVASAPELQMRKIFDLIGYPAEQNINIIDSSDWQGIKGEKWRDNTAFAVSNDGFNIEDSINRWKKHLTNEEISICEWICGPTMKQFGYKLSGIKASLFECGEVLKAMIKDAMISEMFENWAITGEGIERFPTDPLEPSNWEENAIPSKEHLRKI